MHTHTHIYIYTYIYIYIYIYIYRAMSRFIYIYIYIYIYIIYCFVYILYIVLYIFYKDFLNTVLDTSLLNTQHYKVRIKGKVEQSRGRSSALPLNFGVVAIEKRAFWSPSTTVANFTYYIYGCK